MFSRASRFKQLVPVVTTSTIYSMDRWNLIDIVILTKYTMTERIIINKFYKVFKTQTTQQADNNDDIIKIV